MEDMFWKPWSWDVACLQFDDWVSDGLKPPTNSLNLLAVTSIEGQWKIPKSRAGDMKMIPVSQKFFHPISMTLQYTTNSFVANSDLLLTGEARSATYRPQNPPNKTKMEPANMERFQFKKPLLSGFMLHVTFYVNTSDLLLNMSITHHHHMILLWPCVTPKWWGFSKGESIPKMPKKKTV